MTQIRSGTTAARFLMVTSELSGGFKGAARVHHCGALTAKYQGPYPPAFSSFCQISTVKVTAELLHNPRVADMDTATPSTRRSSPLTPSTPHPALASRTNLNSPADACFAHDVELSHFGTVGNDADGRAAEAAADSLEPVDRGRGAMTYLAVAFLLE